MSSTKNIKLLLLPSLSPTMETGKLVKWIKQAGDQIKIGEVVAEIETDKAVISMESGHSGKLVKILVEEGTEDILVDHPIGVIAKEGVTQEEIDSFINNISTKNANPTSILNSINTERVGGYKKANTSINPNTTQVVKNETKQSQYHSMQDDLKINNIDNQNINDRITISPYAKHLASTNALDYKNIQGTGKHSTILARDIESYMQNPTPYNLNSNDNLSGQIISKESKPSVPQALSGMRKAISRKVIHSKQTVPHFYVTSEFNTSKLVEYKNELLNKHQIKTTLNDWFMLATAKALKQVPQLNQCWEIEGETIVQHYQVDINCAIDVGSGPLLVLIPDVANKTLKSIHENMKNIVQKAKDKTISTADLATGTFSISNLGMFNVHSFQAIINTPQVAVLAIGGSNSSNQCCMTISCDHRILDGRDAALFLQALRVYIEDPIMMITG